MTKGKPMDNTARIERRPALTLFRVLVVVAFLLLAASIFTIYWWPERKSLMWLEGQYHQAATIAMYGTDWFDKDLMRSPLMTVFLMTIYKLFGLQIWIVHLIQLALLICAGFLFRRALRLVDVDARTAGWAAILLVVNPLTIAFTTYLTPDLLHLFFLVLLGYCLAHVAHSDRHPHEAHAQRTRLLASAGAGLALGFCLLASDLLSWVWPLLLLPLAWRGSLVQRSMKLALFALALALVIAPAAYRGAKITGSPTITDTSALTRWLGLADMSRVDLVNDPTLPIIKQYTEHSPNHAERVEFATQKGNEIVETAGIFGTFAEQMRKQYFRLFSSNNRLVAQLIGPACEGYAAAYKALPFAINRAVDFIARTWHIAILVLFAMGLVLWKDWRRPWLVIAGGFFMYQLLHYGVHQVKTPALLGLLPIMSIFGGHLMSRLPEFRAAKTPVSISRRITGLLLAALLVMLAILGPLLDASCG